MDKQPTPRQTEMEADGLFLPVVGGWAEDKYAIVGMYAELFSTGMKNKWDERVFLDLYAGAGFNQIRGTQRVVAGSAILSLMMKDRFDKYIFCEKDPEKLNALKVRCRRVAPDANCAFIEGDCNTRVADISAKMPRHHSGNTVLSLCFLDPYAINIKFSTIKALATFRMDFLVLLALDMDANRNRRRYLHPKQRRVDEFLGDSTWRNRWQLAESKGTKFPQFLAGEFAHKMTELGYQFTPKHQMASIRNRGKNARLYSLALFSRSDTGYMFWQQVRKYSSPQISIDFEKDES